MNICIPIYQIRITWSVNDLSRPTVPLPKSTRAGYEQTSVVYVLVEAGAGVVSSTVVSSSVVGRVGGGVVARVVGGSVVGGGGGAVAVGWGTGWVEVTGGVVVVVVVVSV